MVLIEGQVRINGVPLAMRDACEVAEEELIIEATEEAHLLVIEMAKN